MKLVLPTHINMPSENQYRVIVIPSSRLIKPNFDLGNQGNFDDFSILTYMHGA